VAVVVHPDSTALITQVKDDEVRFVETLDASGSCTIGFNTAFLTDTVKAHGAGDGTTIIEGHDALSPVKIYSDIADGYTVLMPMRLEKEKDDS